MPGYAGLEKQMADYARIGSGPPSPYPPAACVSEVPSRGIPDRLVDLETEIAQLNSVLLDLQDRLALVLRPIPPETQHANPIFPACSEHCDLHEVLKGRAYDVMRLRQMVVKLIERVEL